MVSQSISADVEAFLRRALPHFIAGKSVEDSMRAVLDDDARLFTATLDRGTSHYFPTPDDRGRSHSTGARKGDLITSQLSARCHAALNAQSA